MFMYTFSLIKVEKCLQNDSSDLLMATLMNPQPTIQFHSGTEVSLGAHYVRSLCCTTSRCIDAHF